MAWLRRIAVMVALAAAPAVAAPAPAEPYDADATLVEELVVVARERGPAFWTVKDGDTTVYVLGTPSLAPKRMQWDRANFMRKLAGANEVILPPRWGKVRVLSAPLAAVRYLQLKSSTPFEETLPADERSRFAAARERLGQPAKRYKTHNPLAAALLMFTDYRETFEITDSDPTKLIRLLAAQANVPVVEKSYDLAPRLGALMKVSPAAGRVCLDSVLDQVSAGPGRTLAATHAWAEGDVPGALSQERTYERCLGAAADAAAFDQRMKADQAERIAQALKRPGHAVAVVQLRPLLAKGGVLDRLAAMGFEIGSPGEPSS